MQVPGIKGFYEGINDLEVRGFNRMAVEMGNWPRLCGTGTPAGACLHQKDAFAPAECRRHTG
jgi:hypothetical protein